jgi:hypothetical protein
VNGEEGLESGNGCRASGMSKLASKSIGDGPKGEMAGNGASPTGEITSGENGLACGLEKISITSPIDYLYVTCLPALYHLVCRHIQRRYIRSSWRSS